MGKDRTSDAESPKTKTMTNAEAYSFLTRVRCQSENADNPMVEAQPRVGEILRMKGLTEEIIVHAAETLADLILVNPKAAHPLGYRRLSKLVIHGPCADESMNRKAGQFKEYDPRQIMTKAALAMTGYMSKKVDISAEEEGLMYQAIEAVDKYNLSDSTVHKMNKTMELTT